MICDWDRDSLLKADLSLIVRNTRKASVGRLYARLKKTLAPEPSGSKKETHIADCADMILSVVKTFHQGVRGLPCL